MYTLPALGSFVRLEGGGSEQFQEDDTKSIVQKPFKQTLFGSFCLFLIQLVSVVWAINFLVIDSDYYWGCEFKGMDNMW